tara:strand:- start:150 stop:455 length:306 start_codon:yes stop_codon:yes gene_type:complete
MDSNAISKIKINLNENLSTVQSNKINKDSNIKDVAKEFESLFIYQMLKSARRAKLAEEIFSSQGNETYQSLLDQEYAKTISKNHSFGIAEALVRQFGVEKK